MAKKKSTKSVKQRRAPKAKIDERVADAPPSVAQRPARTPCIDLDKGTIRSPDGTLKPVFAFDTNPEMFPAGDPSKLPRDPNHHGHTKTNGEHSKRTQMSAIDAAAQVLQQAGITMNTKTMIALMTEQKLWTSPGGKTPHATLYSAILREIQQRGTTARFVRVKGGFEHTKPKTTTESKPSVEKEDRADKSAAKAVRRFTKKR